MSQLTHLLEWLEWGRHQATLFIHPLTFSFLFVITIFTYLWLNNGFSAKKLNLPPSPPKLPILGNLHQLGFLLHRSLKALSEKYGPLMLLHVGYTPTLVVSSAEMAREITVNHDVAFLNRPQTTVANLLFYGCTNLAYSPYGELWAQLRKISAMELLCTSRVQSFKYVREEEVALMIEKISGSVGSPVNLSELVTILTNDIVCRCALGRKHGGQDGNHNFGELAGKLVKLLTAFSFGDTFPWLGWMDVLTGLIWRAKKVSMELDSFFNQIIEEHISMGKNPGDRDSNKDFVDILLQVQKEDINFTRQNIKALVLDMVVSGTESASTVTEWMLAELVKNPNVMRKAQEEVRRVIGKKTKVDEEDINRMDYLKSVVKETLRLHPSAVINVLESSTDTKVKGYHVPARTRVIVNIWAIQRDSKFWDRAEEFIPERFINNPMDFKGQDYKYIPFGSSRRACPGMSFGLTVIELAIANLLYWFDWQMPGGKEPDMTEDFGISVTMKTPLRLIPLSASLSTTI